MLWIDLLWLLACLELLFLVAVLDCCWFDREGVAFTSQKLIYSFVHQSFRVSRLGLVLRLGLVHSFVELNGKHTDTGIEPGTPIFDLTVPAPLHQWCVPVKKRSNGTLPVLTPGICRL